MPTNEKERKTITIRNIDREIYERASALAKEMGVRIGDLVNEALERLISLSRRGIEISSRIASEVAEASSEAIENMLGETITISDIYELIVSKKDLESIEGKVQFRNINKLILANDINIELFRDKVSGIIRCDELVIPKSLPKLQILSKAKFVKKIVIE